jgi:hypothetical protein
MSNPKVIKVDDIVTSGRSGWWRVLEVNDQKKNTYGPLLKLQLVMDKTGRVITKSRRVFNAYQNWCQKVTLEDIKKFKDDDNKKWDQLTLIIDPTQEVSNKESLQSEMPVVFVEPQFLNILGPPPSLAKK